MEQHNDQQKKDLKVLVAFVQLYCSCKHRDREYAGIAGELQILSKKEVLLCRECRELLEYSLMKRRRCPLDPKPSCKKCHIHCYGREYREKIREIMAFSGRKMILRGRLDYLWHYLF